MVRAQERSAAMESRVAQLEADVELERGETSRVAHSLRLSEVQTQVRVEDAVREAEAAARKAAKGDPMKANLFQKRDAAHAPNDLNFGERA